MDKVTYEDFTNLDGKKVSYAIIDHGNNEYTSMTKELYDAQQAEAKPVK